MTPVLEFVVFHGGLTLPLPAVALALDLERRGLYLRREDWNVLVVGPRKYLTEDDRAGIGRWKPHLLALLEYCDRPGAVQ
jgi:hypothetical protein